MRHHSPLRLPLPSGRALNSSDGLAVWLTLELASVTTALLLLLGTTLAWWLARTQSRFRSVVAAIVALPLVLPPTVLGFYLLLFWGPRGLGGQLSRVLHLRPLPFSFAGLVVASLICSLPFVVQPLSSAIRALGRGPLEAAATLRLGPVQSFFWVALPLLRSSFLTAGLLGFAHTVGEFGVVLMLGGNIPGQTRVLSIALFEHVEALDYTAAHALALGLVLFSFVTLLGWGRLHERNLGS